MCICVCIDQCEDHQSAGSEVHGAFGSGVVGFRGGAEWVFNFERCRFVLNSGGGHGVWNEVSSECCWWDFSHEERLMISVMM